MVLFKNLKFFDLELDMNFNWNKWMETIDFKTFNGNITYVYFKMVNYKQVLVCCTLQAFSFENEPKMCNTKADLQYQVD